MVINIGSALSFRTPESWEVTPDDRQSKIEIVGGIYIEDLGLVDSGETVTCQAIFNAENWALIQGYWSNRTLVNVIDQSGNSLGNRRVIVKKYKYQDKKFMKYYLVDLELWAQ